jgi:hypothetical protein
VTFRTAIHAGERPGVTGKWPLPKGAPGENPQTLTAEPFKITVKAK